MESNVIFLSAATFIAIASIKLNYFFTKRTFSADRAFWLAWIFLIWSAELVTSFPIFEYYYRYPVAPEVRRLTVVAFASAAVGLFIGSVAFRYIPGRSRSLYKSSPIEAKLVFFAQRIKNWVSSAILLFGIYGYSSNRAQFSNLLDLRIAAVTGEIVVSTAMLQISYFAMAFLMLLGFSDGHRGRFSFAAAGFCTAGLILFNLSVGGRINVLVAPALYLIPFAITASQRPHWQQKSKRMFRRLLIFSAAPIVILFTGLQMLRSDDFGPQGSSDPTAVLFTTLLAIPMYVSDTFISIEVHSQHARDSGAPFGYFTFDAFYRAFGPLFNISPPSGNYIFGHEYYRDSPAPWAWTQTNMIPRLISDFGDLYWLAILILLAGAQFLSLHRFRISFLDVVTRSLMVFSSAYSILNVFWMSAFNVYVLLYATFLYFLAKIYR